MSKKMITVQTSEGTLKVPAKYVGEALAVHRPVVGFNKLSKEPKRWTITHLGSGLAAGWFDGPMRDAIQLAKSWDLTFRDELPGEDPKAKEWVRKDQWKRQLDRIEPIAAPDSFEAVLADYRANS
jgi:hypothetical protein